MGKTLTPYCWKEAVGDDHYIVIGVVCFPGTPTEYEYIYGNLAWGERSTNKKFMNNGAMGLAVYKP